MNGEGAGAGGEVLDSGLVLCAAVIDPAWRPTPWTRDSPRSATTASGISPSTACWRDTAFALTVERSPYSVLDAGRSSGVRRRWSSTCEAPRTESRSESTGRDSSSRKLTYGPTRLTLLLLLTRLIPGCWVATSATPSGSLTALATRRSSRDTRKTYTGRYSLPSLNSCIGEYIFLFHRTCR